MIVDIRGTHGSGKSFVVHEIIRTNKTEDVIENDPKKPIGYFLPEINGGIIGRYDRTCGGCDGISPVAEICRRIRWFDERCDVVFLEGILVAHTFQRYSDMAKEINDWNFCFLNTPLKKCIARVKTRRRKAGNLKPLDPKNIIKDHRCIWERRRIQFQEAGHSVIILPWQDPLKPIKELVHGV